MTLDGFDWDEGNRGKCQKHGVSIQEIEDLFETTPLVGPDPNHSEIESRFRAIGRVEGRGLFVVFTLRTSGVDRLVRPISARYMHKREIDAYEEEVSRPEE